LKKKVIVIGAGLGGLAVSVRLAAAGFAVTVLEKNETVGGKINIVEARGYKFDTGASLLTMRRVLDDLFESAGRDVGDYLEIVPLDPICRYFWNDKTVFDASPDAELTESRIRALDAKDADNFPAYLADARRKYEVAEKTFLTHSLNDLPKFLRPRYVKDLFIISSLRTLDSHNNRYFRSAKLRQLFNRFATYNGSSPYQAPATFALIPYVEFGLGVWYVKGGMYELPRTLSTLAVELGVEIFTGSPVDKIVIENSRATGVEIGNKILKSDFVISNADAVETYRNLVKGGNNRIENLEPSCSGFVLLLGVKKKYPMLAHHNIFFSDDYNAEFDSIFMDMRPAREPTIYVCAASRTDETQSPRGCENLFILVNAPYTTERTNWQIETRGYRDLIVSRLEARGLDGLSGAIEFEQTITPEDFRLKYGANRGSIYGVSSNGILSAFMRPPNKARDVEGLYFAGGAAHPGGGIPLVLLSAKLAADLIVREG
jgi:phytoene desaturase